VKAGEDEGQALVLVVCAIAALLVGAGGLGMLARGLGAHADHQRAADLAALAGARALVDAFPRALEPPGSSRHLGASAYLELARSVAQRTAGRNGARRVAVRFATGPLPDRVVVTVSDPIRVPGGGLVSGTVTAEAQLAAFAVPIGDGEYPGPYAYRQGKPMRPDAALAFDRMAAAARRSGIGLIVTSGYRSNAEQARLFAAHPDPKWVAPPGQSLHRLGTELDLGPRAAYRWLAANAKRFGFVQRYAWEAWHYGLIANPGSASVGFAPPGAGAASAVPSFVPAAYREPLRRASSRWSVGAALLAAQLQQESGFNSRSVSSAGAQGIAQFMPGTARSYGLSDPFDAPAAINAQAHLMHDLLRRFASVPLALAAYNAGPGRVAACWCVPPIAETQAYVARIVAIARGAGVSSASGEPPVRLIR
jgi:hypothetical protein